jgi:DHA1 family multidrug resistance protein-like MFS transporter
MQWKRTLYAVWIAQTVSLLAFTSVFPFLPFYIRQLGVTGEREIPRWAGLLGTAPGVTMIIFAPLWGVLADRYGRKIMVERVLFGGAGLLLLMGMVGNVHQLLALRILQGALTGITSASVALVSSVTPSERTGFSLGLMQSAAFVGGSAGPLIGGPLADALGYRAVFYISAVGLLAAGLLVLLLAEEKFIPGEISKNQKTSLLSVISLRGFTVVMSIVFLVQFASTMLGPILPLFTEKIMKVKTGIAASAGVVIAASGITAALSSTLMGRAADRIGHKRILVGCALFSGLLCVPQALSRNIPDLLFLRLIFGLALGGITPTINSLVSSIVPRECYGKAFGITASVTCAGWAVGPVTGGETAYRFGYEFPFLLTGALFIAAGIYALLRIPKSKVQK